MDQRVLIVGDHPHQGETGVLTDDVIRMKGIPEVARVDLDKPSRGFAFALCEASDLHPISTDYGRP